jgi:hypothetical protein
MKTIELRIAETDRMNLKEETSCFNHIRESFQTLEELKTYLIERYGKIPQGRKKIFRDILAQDNNILGQSNHMVIGFLHSFWNADISHNSKNWYQTDWIEFWEQETTRTYNIKIK